MKAEEAGVEPTEDANAPSNGFEARAPHRERYSSGVEHAAVSAAAEEALRPPRCLPLQLQFDHCQHIGGAVLPAQGSYGLRVEGFRRVGSCLHEDRQQLV